MPRGVKKSTADKLRQELEKIRKSISDHEEKIAALKEKEKEVLDQIHDAEMESIRQTMEEKGLDVDALKKILDCYEATARRMRQTKQTEKEAGTGRRSEPQIRLVLGDDLRRQFFSAQTRKGGPELKSIMKRRRRLA